MEIKHNDCYDYVNWIKTKNKIYAALLPDYDKIGVVLDIGMSGFTIEYLALEHLLDVSQEAYLLFTKDGFLINRVDVNVISDIESGSHDDKIRQKLVKFIDLPNNIKSRLDHIIRNYTEFNKVWYHQHYIITGLLKIELYLKAFVTCNGIVIYKIWIYCNT